MQTSICIAEYRSTYHNIGIGSLPNWLKCQVTCTIGLIWESQDNNNKKKSEEIMLHEKKANNYEILKMVYLLNVLALWEYYLYLFPVSIGTGVM